MNFQCPFCQTDLSDQDVRIHDPSFTCDNCQNSGWKVRFILYDSFPKPELGYTILSKDTFIIELNYFKQITCFFICETPYSKPQSLTALNQIKEITPSNADQWMGRVLNLIPFS